MGPLENVPDSVEPEEEPQVDEVRKAQRLAGGLTWFATRTRPDIAAYVSQLASAATRNPERAINLGKTCLRYLAGTLDRGISLETGTLHSRESGGPAAKEGFGDAAYEAGRRPHYDLCSAAQRMAPELRDLKCIQ